MSAPVSRDLDLLYTDVEDSLRESVRAMLTSRCSAESVLAVYEGERENAASLWRALAKDLGLAGLLVPEEYGGAGASAREAAVVLEELGRFAAPVPFLTSSVVATTAALPSTDAGLLSRLATGEQSAVLTVPFHLGTFRPQVQAQVQAQDGSLQGRVTSVAGAVDADVLLVPVATDAGLELHMVRSRDSGVRVTPVVSLDMTRPVADIEFAGAASRRVVDADSGEHAVRHALDLGAALLASEQLGLAEWCLETTVEYLGDRKQFGRAVGGFQAIKHRLADLWVEVESARAAARYAAATAAAGDPDFPVAASLAQAYCSEVAVHAAEECVQLHGGIGMTWEHPAHLYLKRAKADQIAFGNAGVHRSRLAELVDLG